MIRLDAIEATNPWDPWLGIWVAVTRQTEGAGVLNPDQRLTRVEALRFYTINNARLHGEEREKGTIEPGKLADLILVTPDPLTCPEEELRTVRVPADDRRREDGPSGPVGSAIADHLPSRPSTEEVRNSGPYKTPCSGPPGAARASTRRSISGSSTSGGAWCGLIRASITSGPVQPQCLRSTNAPMPSMSAAGFERVNVTQSQLRSDRAANSLSSTSTTSGNASIGSSGRNAARELGRVGPARRGPRTTSTPGIATRGDVKPSGSRSPAGISVGRSRRFGPGDGDDELRALVQAVARVVERVDRRPGLEVQVVRPVDALQDVAEEARRRRGCRGRGRLPSRR